MQKKMIHRAWIYAVGVALVAAAAVVVMGTGVWITVNMDIVPNPPDGLIHAFSEVRHVSLGTAKNIVDGIFLLPAVLVGLVFQGKILGIGVGTVIAVIFGGRVIAFLDSRFHEKLLRAAGMPVCAEETQKRT